MVGWIGGSLESSHIHPADGGFAVGIGPYYGELICFIFGIGTCQSDGIPNGDVVEGD